MPSQVSEQKSGEMKNGYANIDLLNKIVERKSSTTSDYYIRTMSPIKILIRTVYQELVNGFSTILILSLGVRHKNQACSGCLQIQAVENRS